MITGIFIAWFLSRTYVWGTGSYTTISSSGVNVPGWMNASSFKFNSEFWFGSFNRTDVFANPQMPYSYIISIENGVVKAKNGGTGQIEFQSTNASYVFISAFNSLSDGGMIFVSAGTYLIDTKLSIPQKVSLVGESQRVTKFKASASMTALIELPNSLWLGFIKNFELNGWGLATAVIDTNGASHGFLENLLIQNATQDGLYIDGSYAMEFRNLRCNSNGGDGIHIIGDIRLAGQLLFTRCWAYGNTEDGVEIELGTYGAETIKFVMFTAANNGRYGALIRGSPVDVYGGNFESNSQHAMVFSGQGLVTGCYFQNAPASYYGLYVTGNLTAINCRFRNNISYDIVVSTTGKLTLINPIPFNPTTSGQILWEGNFYENGGTASVSNGDYIAHGLPGKPTTVVLTCMNATYDGVPVVVNCDYANTNSTHICVSLYWTNGTAITTPLLVSWYVEYEP